VLGADVQVPYISTTLSLRVPSGTQSGQVFQLRGRGLPRVNASGSGDLQVRVQLWTPQSLTSEQETLVKALRDAEGPPPATRARGFWSRMKDALGA
jgi:molecular chaperone DnaJ